jgi:AcrR family transcriptional regulator
VEKVKRLLAMTTLSQEHILKTALALIDEKGLSALSMRQLGKQLNVDAKAIYYYFSNKESLMVALVQSVFEERLRLKDVAQSDADWRGQLRTIARGFYAIANDHPHLMQYLVQYGGTLPIVFDIIEAMALALQPTGLKPRAIYQVVDLLWGFVPAFVVASPFEATEYNDVEAYLATLPNHAYPATRTLLPQLAHDDLEGDFDFQIAIIIAGIEQIIAMQQHDK